MIHAATWPMRSLHKFAVVLTLILGLTACDNGGSGQSAAAITAQPTDQSVVAGTAATFNVVASDATGYQWQSSTDSGATFVDVSGANIASYSTAVTTLGDSGTQYRVVVSGASNSVTSSAVTLTVTSVAAAPAITVQPAHASVTAPAMASFSVTATGTNLNYQWQQCQDSNETCASWSDLSGATAATYATGATDVSMTGQRFRVIISNTEGSLDSAVVSLNVDPTPVAPVITSQPVDAAVVAPATASFTVAFTSVPTILPLWQYSNDGSNWFNLGVLDNTYTTDPTSIGDNGRQFRAILENTAGSVTTNVVTLTVAAASAPSFTTQPADVTITEGQNAQFTVVVTGTPTPTLQWQLSTDSGSNWSNINGQTGTSLTLVAPALANTGRQFRAVATNSEGAVNSNAATLTVNAAPVNNTWQTAGRIGSVAGSIYHPKIGFDSLGNAIAIWMQADAAGTRYELWANRYIAGSGWGTPQVIYPGVGFRVNWPQLGVDASGNAMVVWELIDDIYDPLPDIWSVSYSTSTGWGTAAGISNDTGAYDSSSPKLAVAGNGTAVAVWSQGNGTSVGNILMATGATGSGWGSPAILATAGIGQVGGPDAVLNATGNGIATWSQLDGSNITLRAALITGGTAGTAQAISTNTGNNYNPHIAVNAGGTAVAIWGQLNGSRFEISSNRYTPGSGWGSPAQVNNPGYPAFNQTPDPQIQLDDAGTATALWVESTGASSPKFWNQQSGTSWGSAGLISYSNNNYRMAGNGAGQILGSRFSGQNLYASPTYIVNTSDWGAGDLLTTTGYIPMELAIDASGNGLAVWIQAESGGGYALWGSLYR